LLNIIILKIRKCEKDEGKITEDRIQVSSINMKIALKEIDKIEVEDEDKE